MWFKLRIRYFGLHSPNILGLASTQQVDKERLRLSSFVVAVAPGNVGATALATPLPWD